MSYHYILPPDLVLTYKGGFRAAATISTKKPVKYELNFRNSETRKIIRVVIPPTGIFDDPARETTLEDVENLAAEIGAVLRKNLDSTSGKAGRKAARKRSRVR